MEQDPDMELRELYNNINRGFFQNQLPKKIHIKFDRRVVTSCIKYKHSDIIKEAYEEIRILISEKDYFAERKTLVEVMKENCVKLADIIKCEYSRSFQKELPRAVFRDRLCKDLNRIVKCNGQCDQCKERYVDTLMKITES